MLTSADEATKQQLDAIDKVRLLLAELKDTVFYEEILAALPQFVACGPQSAGKSSIIRRLSGISLPEAATLCTRVATVLSMRREATESIRVTLSGPEGVVLDEKPEKPASICELIIKAQEKARSASGGKAFVDDHAVTVYVNGPALPNVTLVDLPGFHTADDADSQTVNAMVERYIQMPGTLALHIVKGDQDYGSLLGNDFMRKLSVTRVTVLTHCDKLESSADGRARLAETLDRTSENSSGTFAVDGSLGAAAAEDLARENEALRHVQELDARIEVWVQPLARHLEDRIRAHLHTQYPKALAKLRGSLAATVARLSTLKPKAPIEEVYEMARTVAASFDGARPERMDEVREILERMTHGIKNHNIEPILAGGSTGRSRDSFDEPVEVGQMLLSKFGPVCVTAISGDQVSWTSACEPPKTGTCKLSEMGSGESHSVDDMVADIQALASRRGVRNLVHADRMPIIEAYSKQFAEHYAAVIREAAKELLELIREYLDAAFKCADVREAARPAALKLRTLVEKEEAAAVVRAEAAILALEQHNTERDLIFSPNEHYLNALIQQMVAADKGMATDTAGVRHIWWNVRAYIKVQRKHISESAAKELVRTIVIDVERSFHKLMQTGLFELAKDVVELPQVARERERLHTRQKVLEHALSMLPE
jgi:GTP-binding protein EngB required for normal cell division